MNAYSYAVIAVVSYLLGSTPFGYLLVRLATGEDVRASGSGNIGATNVARRSPLLGVATLVLDAGKGLAAVLLARFAFTRFAFDGFAFNGSERSLVMTAALFAVLGHLYPVWLRFAGGKGVATTFGAFAMLTPKTMLCLVGIFLLVVVAFRYVSLASITVAAAFPLLAWAFHEYREPLDLVIIATASMLVIWKHSQNIGRLASGTESKIGVK